MRVGVLLALATPLAVTPFARAQTAARQPTAGLPRAARDSAGMVRPDSAVAADRDTAARHVPWSMRPRWVMLRSLVIPGWGQATNHAWWKAAVIGGAQAWLGIQSLADLRAVRRFERDVNAARADSDRVAENTAIDRYNDRLQQLNNHEWLLGAVTTYALVDAYVDAHFRGFKREFQRDPALADTARTGAGIRLRVGARRAQLALEWPF